MEIGLTAMRQFVWLPNKLIVRKNDSLNNYERMNGWQMTMNLGPMDTPNTIAPNGPKNMKKCFISQSWQVQCLSLECKCFPSTSNIWSWSRYITRIFVLIQFKLSNKFELNGISFPLNVSEYLWVIKPRNKKD